jgi:hypothetical protein
VGDTLIISGGGSTAVATDELFADAARLGAAEATIADWRERARVIGIGLDDLELREPAAKWDAHSPGFGFGRARTKLWEAEGQARELRRSLVESAERYGATERLVESAWQIGGRVGAWWLGFTTPFWLPPALVGAAGLTAAEALVSSLGGSTPLDAFVAEHRDLLSNPMFVHLVRDAVDSVDEFAGGALHLPVGPFGQLIGAPENASILLGIAGLVGAITGSRVLVDGPVKVERASALPDRRADHTMAASQPDRLAQPVEGAVAAPSGLGELADRIPETDDGAQIRVERYGDAGDARWIVYIGGTVDFTLTAGAETNDMTSNVHDIADDSALDAFRFAGADSSALERAVRLALTEAGARPGDPILPIGHSGGGIAAAGLAADPELNVVAAVNLGGPVASAPIAEGVPLLSIEHEGDFVPATGGWGHPSPERLTVSRSVLEPDRAYESAVPAHELVRYRDTAALLDESDDPRIVAIRERVAEFTGGTEGERSSWIATREAPDAPEKPAAACAP